MKRNDDVTIVVSNQKQVADFIAEWIGGELLPTETSFVDKTESGMFAVMIETRFCPLTPDRLERYKAFAAGFKRGVRFAAITGRGSQCLQT